MLLPVIAGFVNAPIGGSDFDPASPGPIGGTTPAAVSATTLNATGDVTASSTLAFDSSNVQLRVGSSPNSGKFYNGNGQFHARQEAANATIRLVTVGASFTSYLAFDRARGTFAAPTAIQSGDVIGSIVGVGAFDSGPTMNHGTQVMMFAGENWSSTANGCYFVFRTIANTTLTQLDTMVLSSSGLTLAGGIVFGPDNTYKLGAPNATRPSEVHIASQLVLGSNSATASTNTVDIAGNVVCGLGSSVTNRNADGAGYSLVSIDGNGQALRLGKLGVGKFDFRIATSGLSIVDSDNSLTPLRLLLNGSAAIVVGGNIMFGGTGSAVLSMLKPGTTTIQARLTDDSAFGFFQAKLKTDTAAATGLTAGVLSATTNATITVYDSTGQAYRIPCII